LEHTLKKPIPKEFVSDTIFIEAHDEKERDNEQDRGQ
jgi:hypothetical protein